MRGPQVHHEIARWRRSPDESAHAAHPPTPDRPAERGMVLKTHQPDIHDRGSRLQVKPTIARERIGRINPSSASLVPSLSRDAAPYTKPVTRSEQGDLGAPLGAGTSPHPRALVPRPPPPLSPVRLTRPTRPPTQGAGGPRDLKPLSTRVVAGGPMTMARSLMRPRHSGHAQPSTSKNRLSRSDHEGPEIRTRGGAFARRWSDSNSVAGRGTISFRQRAFGAKTPW